MPNLRGFEWVVLVLLVVVLFGAKRLPDAARGLGRSLRIFKAETKGLVGDDAAGETTTTAQQVVPPAIPPVDAPAVTPTPAPPVEPGASADR